MEELGENLKLDTPLTVDLFQNGVRYRGHGAVLTLANLNKGF